MSDNERLLLDILRKLEDIEKALKPTVPYPYPPYDPSKMWERDKWPPSPSVVMYGVQPPTTGIPFNEGWPKVSCDRFPHELPERDDA